jgi:hypothetical protein
MTLKFSQRLSGVGRKISITPPDPSDVDTKVRRVRLELERQMLTGEQQVPGRVDRREAEDDGAKRSR